MKRCMSCVTTRVLVVAAPPTRRRWTCGTGPSISTSTASSTGFRSFCHGFRATVKAATSSTHRRQRACRPTRTRASYCHQQVRHRWLHRSPPQRSGRRRCLGVGTLSLVRRHTPIMYGDLDEDDLEGIAKRREVFGRVVERSCVARPRRRTGRGRDPQRRVVYFL